MSKERVTPVIEFLETDGKWNTSIFTWEIRYTLEDAQEGCDVKYRYRPGTEPELQYVWAGEWSPSLLDGTMTLEDARKAYPKEADCFRYAPNPYAFTVKTEPIPEKRVDTVSLTIKVDASELTKMLDGAVVLTKDEAALLYTAVRYQTMSKHFEGIVAKLAEAAGE